MKVNHIYFKKTVVITNMVAPYRIPLFNVLSKKLHSQLSVYFCVAMEKDRQWNIPYKEMKFEFRFLPGLSIELGRIKLYLKPSLFHYLMLEKPELVIIGGFSLPAILTLLYCKLFNKKLILWSDATPFSERTTDKIRNLIRRVLVRNSSAYIASGTEARKYFFSLGADPKKVAISILTLDVERFSSCCRKFASEKEEIKAQKGLSGKIILYSGRLIEKKGIIYLLKGFKILQDVVDNISLLILGSGETEKELQNYCKKNDLNVYFAGFIQQGELPKYYAIADIFVFPTLSDPWGVVVNEAIAAGLPVICSKWAGAARDLIKDGVNGYIVNPQDVNNLAQKMKELLLNDKKSLEMGRESQEMMRLCTIDKAAKGFIDAIILASKAKQHV